MNRIRLSPFVLTFCAALILLASFAATTVQAQTTLIGGSLNNGNLDRAQATQIVPGFFLPTPSTWTYRPTRLTPTGSNDGLSSEPWAGPAPTPVTTDGNLNGPSPNGFGGPDGGAFYKSFVGSAANPITIDLYQDVPATPGLTYTLTGWAGAESNMLGTAVFALDFLDASSSPLASSTLILNTAGLFTDNGQPFDYKQYTVTGAAPAGASFVRARSSLLNGIANPAGGGQAFVVDDFTLTVPEPASLSLLALASGTVLLKRRRA